MWWLGLWMVACGDDSADDAMGLDSAASSTTASSSSTTAPGSTTRDASTGPDPDGTGGTTNSTGSTGPDDEGNDESTGSTGGEEIDQLDVLFIGNSHTYLDDIPETDLPLLIADLALSRGKTLVVDSVAEPFRSLEQHWIDGEASELIALGGWDLVVLQERYQPSVDDPALTLEYAELFAAEIEAAGADPMVYVLWARDDELEVQPAIIDNAMMVADAIGAELVPVGPAWASIRADYPTMVLAQDDPQSHANRRGAYLSATVFYGALFLDDPVGLPAGTILDMDPTAAEAELLQTAAAGALAEF